MEVRPQLIGVDSLSTTGVLGIKLKVAKLGGEHLRPLHLLSQDRSEAEYAGLVGLLVHFLSISEIPLSLLAYTTSEECPSLVLYDTLILARP